MLQQELGDLKMAAYAELRLVPKEGKGNKEVTIKYPAVTMTVQEFCDFHNRIDEVVGFWAKDNFKPEDKKLVETIEMFLDEMEIPEGLTGKYPALFEVKTTTVNLTKKSRQ